MTVIRQEDFVQSIADAFQFISYYHPLDFVEAVKAAYEREQAPAAKDALAQILVNSRLCAEGHRPICQDTGMAVVFLRIGMKVRWDTDAGLQAMVDEGVRRAYTNPDNPLRASVLADPAGARRNTRDNTPAVVHVELVPGDTVDVRLAAKGGGSENKARFAVLNPSDSIVDWVLNELPQMGAGWCPPGVLGLGIGGSPEKAMVMAKEALLAPIDIQALKARGPASRIEELRLELYDKVNALGIGAQGLGGLTTVLDVKILDYPTHAASLPVALIPNCAATRHLHFTLDGSGPARFEPPPLAAWPQIAWSGPAGARRVNLDALTPAEIAQWKAGEALLLSGKLLTGRDAAHKKIAELVARGEPLPVDFKGRFIYYVGPVDPVRGEAVGPAGPTTATRMDKFTELMLGRLGILGMVGKAERGPEAVAAIRRHGAVYCIAVGGAAYLVAKAIRAARVVAFPELGMEAIYEFEVQDMPVTVAVDSQGHSVHEEGPREWRIKIEQIAKAGHA
ncbi:homodimeric fumarase (class I) [Sulfuritortus calidifontis]|uniref:Fumarate hydratase class I n=1 Tax=Sulfuritortus calidifontis TaxID=1914471 RepID=A0A4R3JXQ8_9PROT|nr:fumarate hydratase [Sulfuritortus calidifontis]TCS73299.1 homodimeric fumarase (class I) [Sulfuritortus calidifontis]